MWNRHKNSLVSNVNYSCKNESLPNFMGSMPAWYKSYFLKKLQTYHENMVGWTSVIAVMWCPKHRLLQFLWVSLKISLFIVYKWWLLTDYYTMMR